MSQAKPTTAAPSSWIFFLGLLLGGGLLAFIAYESFPTKKTPSRPATGSHIVELTEGNWQKEVLESNIPVLVDFSAEWCGPCQTFAPTVEKLAEVYAGKAKVGQVDIDTNQALAKKYDVRSIPRVMIFQGGEPVGDFTGVQSKDTLVRALDAALAKSRS